MKTIIALRKHGITSSMLLLIGAIYIVLFDNSTFWSKFTAVTSGSFFYQLLVQCAFAFLMLSILYIFMSVFSYKKSSKYVIITLLILSATISYFMDVYGTVISHSMIQNIVETDTNEAMDLLSFTFFKHIFIYGVIPSIFVFFINIKKQSIKNELITRLGVLAILLTVTFSSVYVALKDVAFIGRENRDLKYFINPIFPISVAYKFIKYSTKDKEIPLEEVYSDSTVIKKIGHIEKNTVLVIVVGETARASNFNFNGYEKNTTPLLNKIDIINYPNTSSCGTATAESLPCMFSNITHDKFDIKKIRHSENLLDALKYAGINVLWRDNNSGCKGVCSRSETEIMNLIADEKLCKNGECHDEILLKNLSTYIKNINKDTVIVLHQLGSHGPAYYKRAPEKYTQFQPECKSKALQECSNKEISNAYDNTILYTDYILSQVINILKSNSDKTDTAMIYMSDHGESLGEKGIYLHGLPYFMAPDEQTTIPFIVWLSKNIRTDKSISYTCLNQQSDNAHSHDNLVHSVLGLMDIKTKNYNPKLDVFSSCRNYKSNLIANASISAGAGASNSANKINNVNY